MRLLRSGVTFACLLALLVFMGTAVAQVDEAADGDAAAGDDEGGDGEDGEKKEECEEAWEYVEFLKENVKDKIETILQDTLFHPRPLLEDTVTRTMEEVLEIRDDILARTKSIRTEDGEVNICEDQNIKQEDFLTLIRMQVMSVLLALIEKEAATPEKLQDVGKQLLSIRAKTNGEITRMIMLRESSGQVRTKKDDCDCGILGEVVEGLDKVINMGEEDGEKDGEEAADEVVEEGAEEDEDAAPGDAAAGADGEEGEEGDSAEAIEMLTMVLMTVDAEIGSLYNEILGELEAEARMKLADELQALKSVSTELHEALSKLHDSDAQEAIERIIRRDIRSIRNDVKRLLDICQQRCPGECDSCGAEKIDEVSDKLRDYKANVEDLEEEEAKDSIRSDLMGYLTQVNSDMTDLLKEKAEKDELDECGAQSLEVIEKIKGPLWMMVNITIFGDSNTMSEMIGAMEQAMLEMRSVYCGPDNSTQAEPRIEKDECDLKEINTAKDWISDIDTIISEDLFKSEDDGGRRNAMMGIIELKSSMDDRVRSLFQDNLRCKEEVEQIKNLYGVKLTECLAEMMNPRLRYETLNRSERVQCLKDLRIMVEERRGLLLMREIESRISAALE